MKKIKLLAPALIIITLLLNLAGCGGGQQKLLDGTKMDNAVYELLKNRREAEVIRHFSNTYGAEVDNAFWNRKFDEGTPKQMLEEMVIEDFFGSQVIFSLGYSYDATTISGFEGFFKALADENRRRAKAIENGETVYGPVEFTASDFMDHTLSNLSIQLPPLMEGKELKADEAELLKYYEAVKESQFRTASRVSVQMVIAPISKTSSDVASREGQALANVIEEELARGADFEQLMRRYNSGGEVIETEIVDNSITSSRFAYSVDLITQTEEGEIGGPLITNNEVTFIRCLKKDTGGVLPYSESKTQVKTSYLQQEFLDYVEREVIELKTSRKSA